MTQNPGSDSLDPEILTEFVAESKALLVELQGLIEQLEKVRGDVFPEALVGQFVQKIDRIMGTVKTLSAAASAHAGLASIGKLAELCKSIGSLAIQKKRSVLLPYFAAFWSDALEVIEELLNHLSDVKKTESLTAAYPAVLQGRLAWLKRKLEESGR